MSNGTVNWITQASCIKTVSSRKEHATKKNSMSTGENLSMMVPSITSGQEALDLTTEHPTLRGLEASLTQIQAPTHLD